RYTQCESAWMPSVDGNLAEGSQPYSDDEDALNEVEVNGNWTPQEKALHEARLKAKAKRRLRKSSSRNSTSESFSESGELVPGDPHSPKGKANTNDRKSRTGKGRGLPKKGGAGGKGVWGAAGMVYEVEEPDARDPNYDESSQGNTVYATVGPEVDEKELEKWSHPIVQEYFEHGDTKEVEVVLLRGRVPVLEGKASHRELTSPPAVPTCRGKMLSQRDMGRAFDKILKELPDLILYTPEAPQMLGQFIARAIADHVLPMDFLDCYKGKVDCEHARVALDRAAVLLTMKREMVRLDNVWGVGGGLRPVKHLIKEMNLLLKEYLISGDVAEAEHCLRDLEVPHFHHELVYEAVVMVLESKGESASHMMMKLLQSLWKTGLITVDQMNRVRLFPQLLLQTTPEISLDVPHAHAIMETFVDLCYQEAVITKQLRDACPSRRKRFVSEGDGGLIKN
uniref:Programmed cell death 4a n=1 Tax=Salarias fasciatus TaxID=181472 RepID=A0A672GT51_SALFA